MVLAENAEHVIEGIITEQDFGKHLSVSRRNAVAKLRPTMPPLSAMARAGHRRVTGMLADGMRIGMRRNERCG